MPRNKSEKHPHPEVPKRFHERIRLFERDCTLGTTDAERTYTNFRRSFTDKEDDDYYGLQPSVRATLSLYYRAAAEAEAYAP